MAAEESDAYQRGLEAGRSVGEIQARLAAHDQRFAALNGSLARIAEELHGMNLAVQRLGDQADASRITTAALKEADVMRHTRREWLWAPWQKVVTVILGGIGAALTIYLAVKGIAK